MRQLCPSCFQTIDVPDSAAGSTFTCPKCEKPFTVPPAYAPTVTPPADKPLTPPPPGLAVPPLPAATAADPDPAATRAVASSLVRYLPWVPAAGLTLAFVLTFFPWAGLYPGGVSLFTQLPWQAPFKGFSDNEAVPIELLSKTEGELTAALGRNFFLLFPYLILLLFAVAFAWLERFLKDPSAATLPGPIAWVANLWPRRLTILAGLTGALFVLVGLQTLRGMAIETAAYDVATARADARLADGSEESKKYRALPDDNRRKTLWREVVVGQEYGMLGVRGTLWRDLAVLAHLAAFAAAVARVRLDRRTN